MKAITLAVSLCLALAAQAGCATMTLEEAVAKKGLVGACEYIKLAVNPADETARAKVRAMFERLFPIELKIERVVSKNQKGESVGPLKWGELLTVGWRVTPRSLPRSIASYELWDPSVWFSAGNDRSSTRFAWNLGPEDASRMLTGKTVTRQRSNGSIWKFLKGVLVDAPALAISGGLIGSLGESKAVPLDEAVRDLQRLVSQVCRRSEQHGGRWRERDCQVVRAVVKDDAPTLLPPTHLRFEVRYIVSGHDGQNCGISSQGVIPLPDGNTATHRVTSVFNGQWRAISDFEKDQRSERKSR